MKELREFKTITMPVSFYFLLYHFYFLHAITTKVNFYAFSKTADSDTVSTYQVSSVQLVTDKKLEAFNNA